MGKGEGEEGAPVLAAGGNGRGAPDNMYQDTKEETNEEEEEERCDTRKMKRNLTSPPMNLTILLSQASWDNRLMSNLFCLFL